MLGLLDSLQTHKLNPVGPLQQPPSPPPNELQLQLGNPSLSTNLDNALGGKEGVDSDESGADSDSDGSDDSNERLAKKRITPDAKYPFFGR